MLFRRKQLASPDSLLILQQQDAGAQPFLSQVCQGQVFRSGPGFQNTRKIRLCFGARLFELGFVQQVDECEVFLRGLGQTGGKPLQHGLRVLRSAGIERVRVSLILRRQGQAVQVAEVFDVVIVIFVKGIAETKIHQPLRLDAADFRVTDLALPSERISRVSGSTDDLPLLTANVRVNIHLMPTAILEDEIVLPVALAGCVPIAQPAEDAHKSRQIELIDGNIQIGMRTGLPAKMRVHRPTAVEDDRNTGNFRQIDHTQSFFLVHLHDLLRGQAERYPFEDLFEGIALTRVDLGR